MAYGFSSDDPEPFGSKAKSYNEQLVEFEHNLSEMHLQYVSFQEQVRNLSDLPFRQVFRLPLEWYKLRNEIFEMMQKIPDKHDALATINQSADQLKYISWEIAEKSQNLFAKIQGYKNSIGILSEAMIHDEILDQVAVRLDEWETTLHTSLPAVFFSPDRNVVIEQVDKESAVKVYRIIVNADADMGKVAHLLERWVNRWQVLAKLIPEVDGTLQSIKMSMKEASENKLCPIRWNESDSKLTQYLESYAQISPLEKSRTTTRLEHDAEIISAIREDTNHVRHTIDQVINAREKMMHLWSSMTLLQGQDWIKRRLEFCDEIIQYHPSNFNKDFSPGQLRTELLNLSGFYKNNPHARIMAGLNESEVEGFLGKSIEMMNTQEALQPKVTRLQEQFNEFQKNIQLSLEKIQQSSILVSQLITLLKTNTFLHKTTGKVLPRFLQDLDKAMEDFNQPQNGSIEKKISSTNNLIEKITGQANRWLIALDEDLLQRKTKLAEDARILNDSVCLDEPALKDVDQLIKSGISESLRSIQPKGFNYPLLEAVKYIRDLNDNWQRCIAAENALKDIAGAVLERYRRAEKSRQLALLKYEKVDNLLPESLKWPPSTQNIHMERKKISELEKQWLAFKHEKNRALTLVGLISDISEQYQGLSVQLASILDKAQQEHKRVEQYEQRFNESKLLWQRQVNSRQGNFFLSDSVREFLEEIDHDFDSIKIRYSKGSLVYNQVVQNIRGLCRKIDDALMPIDQVQVIDINGVVQKKPF